MRLFTVFFLLFGGAIAHAAEGFDPRTVPADKRIAYVNKLIDCGGKPTAAADYAAAEEARWLLPLYKTNAQGETTFETDEAAEWVRENEHVLRLRLDWPDAYVATVDRYLAKNQATIAAVEAATKKLRSGCVLRAESGRLTDADWFLSHKGFANLMALKAAQEARKGNWAKAYRANKRLHRIATHARQGPFLIDRVVAWAIVRTAHEQLLLFIHEHPCANPLKYLTRLQAERRRGVSDDVVDRTEWLYALDNVEMQFAWAENPDKYPSLTETLSFFVNTPDPGLRDALGTSGVKVPFKSVEEYRQALRKTSSDDSWAVQLRLRRVYDEWASQPTHVALRTRDEYAKRYVAIAREDPMTHLYDACGFIPFGQKIRLQASTDAQINAVDTVLALHAYKARHGNWPTTLNALTPGVLKKLPVDPYSGKPLCYRRSPDGKSFTLYSFGPDLDDDQGRRRKAESLTAAGPENDGDLVYWPPKPPEWNEPS